MQRFVRPVLFGLLVLAVLLCAVYTGRGTSFVNPFLLDRFADFGAGSPLLSTLLLVALLPAGLLVLLVPEAHAVTVAVSDLGFWPGLFASVFALTAAAATACVITRTLLQSTVHRFVAARRQAGSGLRKATMPVEYCLGLTVLLLGIGTPVALAGMLLGLCGMRTKTFCVAAVPVLFARAAALGLATVEAGMLTLALLMLLGTVLGAGMLYWVAVLWKKRRELDAEEDAQAGLAGQACLDASEQQRQTSRAQAADARRADLLRLDDLPHDAPASAPAGDSLAVSSQSLVVCVPEEDMEGSEEAAALVAEAARSLELRVITCRMTGARSTAENVTILGGFRDVQAVADLDELFVRAFQEGASQVLAVRACTPCVRREVLAEALEAVQHAGLVLVPLTDGERSRGLCLAGLCQRLGKARYTQGLLARCDFTSDLAFALTGYARHPAWLKALPALALCRPLVSVVVLAGEKSTTLANTIYAAGKAPWTQCLAALLPGAEDMAADAAKTGARVVSLADLPALTGEVEAMAGRYLLLVADGVLLPENFDLAVWETMQQDKAVLGAFSLPASQPSLQRTLRWLGSVARPGQGTGPWLEQGIFLERALFVRLGGLSGEAGLDNTDVSAAVARLVSHAALEGRTVVHNKRVRLLARKLANDAAGRGLLAQAREGVDTILGKKGQPGKPDQQGARAGKGDAADSSTARGGRSRGAELLAQARAMVDTCDHCGRCTHCSPMLHRHGMDLSDLPGKPLLAWHCFLCNSCTLACDKGIDGVALARLLRKAHVCSHGNRLARPGHGKTLALARLVGVSARSARPGKNLLLDADFCCAYPKTALALARFLYDNGRGVILAESGAALANLGMEEAACKKVAALRRVMEEKGVTTLYAISPVTCAWLVSRGISTEPVFTALRELLMRPLDLGPYHVMIPCADKGKESFGSSLQPLLSGSFREIDIPCCGGGGEAAVLEPQLSSQLKQAVKSVLRGNERVLTYATHCAESLARAGVPTEHVLSALFGLAERPQAGPAQIAALVRSLVQVAALGKDTAQPAPEAQGLMLRGLDDVQDAGDSAASAAETQAAAAADAADGTAAQRVQQRMQQPVDEQAGQAVSARQDDHASQADQADHAGQAGQDARDDLASQAAQPGQQSLLQLQTVQEAQATQSVYTQDVQDAQPVQAAATVLTAQPAPQAAASKAPAAPAAEAEPKGNAVSRFLRRILSPEPAPGQTSADGLDIHMDGPANSPMDSPMDSMAGSPDSSQGGLAGLSGQTDAARSQADTARIEQAPAGPAVGSVPGDAHRSASLQQPLQPGPQQAAQSAAQPVQQHAAQAAQPAASQATSQTAGQATSHAAAQTNGQAARHAARLSQTVQTGAHVQQYALQDVNVSLQSTGQQPAQQPGGQVQQAGHMTWGAAARAQADAVRAKTDAARAQADAVRAQADAARAAGQLPGTWGQGVQTWGQSVQPVQTIRTTWGQTARVQTVQPVQTVQTWTTAPVSAPAARPAQNHESVPQAPAHQAAPETASQAASQAVSQTVSQTASQARPVQAQTGAAQAKAGPQRPAQPAPEVVIVSNGFARGQRRQVNVQVAVPLKDFK